MFWCTAHRLTGREVQTRLVKPDVGYCCTDNMSAAKKNSPALKAELISTNLPVREDSQNGLAKDPMNYKFIS
jgi:hypothetical protein